MWAADSYCQAFIGTTWMGTWQKAPWGAFRVAVPVHEMGCEVMVSDTFVLRHWVWYMRLRRVQLAVLCTGRRARGLMRYVVVDYWRILRRMPERHDEPLYRGRSVT